MIILDDSIILENNECKTLSLIGGTDIKLQYKNIEKLLDRHHELCTMQEAAML